MKMTLTYPRGEYNDTVEVEATEQGIEIEWIGIIPWDWVDAARPQPKLTQHEDVTP